MPVKGETASEIFARMGLVGGTYMASDGVIRSTDNLIFDGVVAPQEVPHGQEHIGHGGQAAGGGPQDG